MSFVEDNEFVARWKLFERFQERDLRQETLELLHSVRERAVETITRKNRAESMLKDAERRVAAGDNIAPALMEILRRNAAQATEEVERLKREIGAKEEDIRQKARSREAAKYPPDRQAAALALIEERDQAIRHREESDRRESFERKSVEIGESLLTGFRKQGGSPEDIQRMEQELGAARVHCDELRIELQLQKTVEQIRVEYTHRLANLRRGPAARS